MPARPRLRPGLPRAWRDPTTLQVGLAPGPGVVLTGVRPGDEALLGALDGAHDLDQLRQLAARHHVAHSRLAELIDVLGRSRLILDDVRSPVADRADLTRLGEVARARLAPDADAWSLVHDTDGLRLIAARGRRHVVIEGGGRFASALAATLLATGVGAVTLRAPGRVRAGDVLPAGAAPVEVGRPWPEVALRARARLAGAPLSASGQPSAPTQPPAPVVRAFGDADLAVLVGIDVLDSRVGDDLVRRDVPHLAVVVSADRIVVGPLVRPGRSACLRCLDLHRRDRDPAWPHLVAQLLGRRGYPAPVGESALCTAAAGLAALQVLAELDAAHTGRPLAPDAVGRTLEISLPDAAVRRRPWRPHPGCGCSRLPTAPVVPAAVVPATAPPSGSPARGPGPWPMMVP
ncbi:MAG: TOMM precursor leader peptide-binding protein [Rhodoferax sp.]|nr:TOMM precursor leader peptide-binding protein [Actinomycetota bacterium]